jgi:pimeloyl-ACP methyl ester carboxylesterase
MPPSLARALQGASSLAAVCVLLVCASCSRSPVADDMGWTSCRLKGIEIAVRCTTVTVPEDRAHPEGRQIALHVAVVPALARRPEPDAIFVLAGGPGQSATDVAGLVFPLFSKPNREHDLVFVDQRGTGDSHLLSCQPETARVGLADAFDADDLDARIGRCAARLMKDADLTKYTTSIAMRDLDAVRTRLGYTQIDLWGGSYGTRAALEYARQFPDHVRTMTLDGVAPASQKLPLSFGVDTYATLVGLLADCEADVRCSTRYPALRRDADALVARLATTGADIDVVGPLDGKRVHLRLTPIALAQLLRTPLYASITASIVPAAITAAAHGDFDAFAALLQMVGGSTEQHLALGMHLSVVCAEDVAAITADERARAKAEVAKSVVDGRPNPFAELYLGQYDRYCHDWPRGYADAGYFEPLTGKPGANIPTLMLSGGIDPATPPVHAEEVARTLTRVKHLVARNIGHGVSLQGCAPDLFARFIKGADPAAIDGACLATIPRPPFDEGIRDGSDLPNAKGPLP